MAEYIHHVEFVVSNAIQASFWFCTLFGFKKFAERRTSTTLSIAVRNGKAVLVFSSPNSPSEEKLTKLITLHGDFVYNVAYVVDNLEEFLKVATENGAVIGESTSTHSLNNGVIKSAQIQGSAGDIVHTLYQFEAYKGFLPGFEETSNIGFCESLSSIPISHIDHVVEAHPSGSIDNIVDWYEKTLHFHRFWSIDDKQVHTNYSALKAAIVTNESKQIQVTLVEPVQTNANGRGQVQEFLDYHTSAGIQHLAFYVDDILEAVAEMRRRSVEFLAIPSRYYDKIEERLKHSNINVEEDLKQIREHQLLIDFDENGYLLQCFTKPVQPRPTFFLEIIKRNNFSGFGAGNFKALFEAVELEQQKRGTLFCGKS